MKLIVFAIFACVLLSTGLTKPVDEFDGFLDNDYDRFIDDASNLPDPVELSFVKIEPSTGLNASKNPVMFYHGIFSDKESLIPIGHEIAEQTKRVVYCFDVRDHGHSPFTNEFSFAGAISDMVHFLNNHKIEKAVFLGHSLGGMILGRLPTLFPNLVEKLVIIDINPKTNVTQDDKPNFMRIFLMQLKTALDKMRDDKMDLQTAKAYLYSLLEPTMKEGSKEFVDKLMMRDGKISFEFNVEALLNFVSPHEEVDITPNFDGDVLEIYGGESPLFNKSDFETMLQMYPKCKFECVEGCGHNVYSVKPKEFMEKLAPFLNQ